MDMRHGILVFIICTFAIVPAVSGLEISQIGGFNFGVAYDIVYREDIAYVSGNNGVDVFDVSDRENPVKLTRIGNQQGAFGLELLGDKLYIAGTGDGLFIVDVSEPGNPVVLGSFEMMATDVNVDSGYAYVSSGTSYSIIDVNDPENPEIISTIPGSGRSDHIKVIEDILYLCEANIGLKVYDISDRTHPIFLSTVSGTIGIFDIKSDGSTLYLACHSNGIKVLDITDRSSPRIIGSFNNGGEAYGIHITGDYLLVADLQQGVEVLDISSPGSPSLMASWASTHPHGVSGDSRYIYLADQDHGLEIFIYGEDVERSTNNQWVNRIPVNTAAVALGVLFVVLVRRNADEKYL